jgi:hypothetical protein
MATRPRTTTTAAAPDVDESAPLPVGQGKRTDSGQFRLQVDRQTKASYVTYEAAEQAGLVIKLAHPILQVAIYDAVGGLNKILEAPVLEAPKS